MKPTVYDEVQAAHEMVANRMKEVDDTLIYTALFGSQNYHMDNENSDVDVHCMYVQHPKRLILNDSVHYPLIEGSLAYGGKADVKTVHDMMAQFRKGNLNFLELLWTPYIAVTPGWEWFIHYLRSNREVFLEDHYHLCVTWGGFCRQMIARTTRNDPHSHFLAPSEKVLSGFNPELGYNPKALANAGRIRRTMERFLYDNVSFGDALVMNREEDAGLMDVKNGLVPYNEAMQKLGQLITWLEKFLKWNQDRYDMELEHPVFSQAKILSEEMEMEAFARSWRLFDKNENYLKNFKK